MNLGCHFALCFDILFTSWRNVERNSIVFFARQGAMVVQQQRSVCLFIESTRTRTQLYGKCTQMLYSDLKRARERYVAIVLPGEKKADAGDANKVAYYVIYTSAALESAFILKRITARCAVIGVRRKQLRAVPASLRHDELRKQAHCCYAVAGIQAQRWRGVVYAGQTKRQGRRRRRGRTLGVLKALRG